MIKTTQAAGVKVEVLAVATGKAKATVVHKPGATVPEIGKAAGADYAVNFNFANNETGVPIGRLIVGGKTVNGDIPKTTVRDELYMLPDGSWHIGRAPANAVQSVQGSPRLTNNHVIVWENSVKRDQTDSSVWAGQAYRIAAGIMPDGTLIFAKSLVTCSMGQWAMAMLALGCRDSLNGDGGGSAVVWQNGQSFWARKMGSGITIEEVETVSNPFKLIGDDKPEVVVDLGHGGADPGATNSAAGIIEKQITLKAGLLLRDRLKAHGIRVAVTRDSDITLDAGPRANLVKNSGAKYCLSVHVNAGGGDGAEVIHSIHNDGKLANAIAAGIKAAGQNVRRVFCRAIEGKPNVDYYYMHRETGTVSTQIIELFFLDSKATGPDADLNEYKTELDAWVEGALRGFLNHTGRSYIPIVKPADPKPTVPGPFVDVPGDHWSAGSVEWAKNIGLLAGKPDGTLGFGEPVTIERQAVLLHRLYEIIKGGK